MSLIILLGALLYTIYGVILAKTYFRMCRYSPENQTSNPSNFQGFGLIPFILLGLSWPLIVPINYMRILKLREKSMAAMATQAESKRPESLELRGKKPTDYHRQSTSKTGEPVASDVAA